MRQVIWLVWIVLALLAGSAAAKDGGVLKRNLSSARLLLPYFEVNFADTTRGTTLFAVRNESDAPVPITIRYYKSGIPQVAEHSEQATLAAKQIKTVNLQTVRDIEPDDEGIARGYVIIETDGGESVIQGDYFQVTATEAFANGDRLVDIDPQSASSELCRSYSIRFLNGGVFSGGTKLTVWLQSSAPIDTQDPVFFFRAYSEAGELRFQDEVFADEVAFQVPISNLLSAMPFDFGAVEIEFNDTVGHISAVMDARGVFSVGLSGSCRDG